MHTPTPGKAGFKRQVVFRIDADDWPLLEAAAREQGSIQAAVLAGIRALNPTRNKPATEDAPAKPKPTRRPAKPASRPTPPPPDEEIRSREAAQILGIKTDTVSAYIRSGRLPGRYDAAPTWRGWLTTRSAVTEYQKRRG